MTAEQVVASMEVGASEVAVIVPHYGPLGATWEEHLLAQVEDGWRVGEWDPDSWAFIPDPGNVKTRLFVCDRVGCDVRVVAGSVCMSCRKEQRANAWTAEELMARPRTTPAVLRSHRRRPDCIVFRDGVTCRREQLSRGLCSSHYQTFAKVSDDGVDDEVLRRWLAQPSRALERLPECAVAGCEHERQSSEATLCAAHYQSRRRVRRSEPTLSEEDYLRWVAEPYLPAYSLPLMVLPRAVRAELLLVMQTFDLERGLSWDAANWVRMFDRIRKARVSSVLDRDASEWLAEAESSSSHMWRHLLHRLAVEDDRFHGRETDESVLSPFDLGLTYSGSKPNKSIVHRQRPIDFSVITQPWLRNAVVHYVRVMKPPMEEIRRLERLCGFITEDLRATLPGSEDPANLNGGVMDSIVALVNRTWDTEKTQQNYLAGWWKVCEHANRNNLWDDVPKSFERSRSHKATGATVDYDENGAALPEAVVNHLSRYLGRLGVDEVGMTRSGWSAQMRGAQYRALVTVLRDTGRRPNEVVALRDDCVRLDTDGVSWVLVWDNTKGKRLGRRLPIDSHLAAAITEWQETKAAAGLDSQWLFPSSTSNDHHVSTATLDRALDEWVKVVPPLAFPVMHLDGVKRVFDLETIVPYSFRHTYAQRHADAGTSIKELSELMDHRSVNTTMGYFRAGWERKREAQERMSDFTKDRHGLPAAVPSSRYGTVEVAVPFGGCIEPGNVRAAGHACPTRFKCVGCTFYRPDPSYIPSIEMHIDKLRTETAFMVANASPSYMVEANRHEIADYEKVVDQMNEQLDALPEAEREQVEMQMAILRRARAAEAAGVAFTLEPVSAVAAAGPADEAGVS